MWNKHNLNIFDYHENAQCGRQNERQQVTFRWSLTYKFDILPLGKWFSLCCSYSAQSDNNDYAWQYCQDLRDVSHTFHKALMV